MFPMSPYPAATSGSRPAPSRRFGQAAPPLLCGCSKTSALHLLECLRSQCVAPCLINPSRIGASPVTGGLQFEHLGIAAAQACQSVVVSFFRDAPVLEHHDPVGHPYC